MITTLFAFAGETPLQKHFAAAHLLLTAVKLRRAEWMLHLQRKS